MRTALPREVTLRERKHGAILVPSLEFRQPRVLAMPTVLQSGDAPRSPKTDPRGSVDSHLRLRLRMTLVQENAGGSAGASPFGLATSCALFVGKLGGFGGIPPNEVLGSHPFSKTPAQLASNFGE